MRRAAIEVNLDATRLLVGDVNTLSGALLREAYSREVVQGKGSLEVVVRSLTAEARDVGASNVAVVVRSAVRLCAPDATAWTAADEAIAAWRCARSRSISEGVVVTCVRTRRQLEDESRDERPWSLSRGPPPVWQLCAADESGHRTFATSLGLDGSLVDPPPAWLEGAVTIVGDEVSLARCLDAIQGTIHVEAHSLKRKLAATHLRRHQTAAVAAAQLELLIAVAREAGIREFTYLRSFGLCLGALLSNDLFAK